MVQLRLENLYILLVQFYAIAQEVVKLPNVILHLLGKIVEGFAHLVVIEDDRFLLFSYAEFEFLWNIHLLLEDEDRFCK